MRDREWEKRKEECKPGFGLKLWGFWISRANVSDNVYLFLQLYPWKRELTHCINTSNKGTWERDREWKKERKM